METENIYGIGIAAKVAEAIASDPEGWQKVKQGIRAAAAEAIKTEESLYYAVSLLDSRHPGRKGKETEQEG